MDSKALVLKPESTTIVSPAISPIVLTNWFLTFNPGSPATYSNALASAYDPFIVSSQKPITPFVKYDKPSPPY